VINLVIEFGVNLNLGPLDVGVEDLERVEFDLRFVCAMGNGAEERVLFQANFATNYGKI